MIWWFDDLVIWPLIRRMADWRAMMGLLFNKNDSAFLIWWFGNLTPEPAEGWWWGYFLIRMTLLFDLVIWWFGDLMMGLLFNKKDTALWVESAALSVAEGLNVESAALSPSKGLPGNGLPTSGLKALPWARRRAVRRVLMCWCANWGSVLIRMTLLFDLVIWWFGNLVMGFIFNKNDSAFSS